MSMNTSHFTDLVAKLLTSKEMSEMPPDAPPTDGADICPEMMLDCLIEMAREATDPVPGLLHSLRFLTEAAETEPAMSIYRAHIKQAREVMASLASGSRLP